MAIFSRRALIMDEARKMLSEAYSVNTLSTEEIDRKARSSAELLEEMTKSRFSWLRVSLAFALVIFVFVMAFLSGQKPGLEELYRVLLHAGEIALGGLFGILLGEAVK